MSYQSLTTVTKDEEETESISPLYFLSWRSGELSFSCKKQFCELHFSEICAVCGHTTLPQEMLRLLEIVTQFIP